MCPRTPTPASFLATAVATTLLVTASACSSPDPADPDPSPSPSAASSAPAADAGRSPSSTLTETEVPFTEPESAAPVDADVPTTLYAVLSDGLDPRDEHLAAYDGSNDAATGVGAGKVPGGWSMNVEWAPRGLVGILVADAWPDGWLCVDAYPGCRPVELAGGGTAQALAVGRSEISVGYEQPDGEKVIVSAVDIADLSASELAETAADERLDLP